MTTQQKETTSTAMETHRKIVAVQNHPIGEAIDALLHRVRDIEECGEKYIKNAIEEQKNI